MTKREHKRTPFFSGKYSFILVNNQTTQGYNRNKKNISNSTNTENRKLHVWASSLSLSLVALFPHSLELLIFF